MATYKSVRPMPRSMPLMMLCAALLAQADERANRLVGAGVAEFNAAYQAWDGARFAAASDLFHQAVSHAPASSAALYWLGTTEFHRMLRLETEVSTRARKSEVDAAREAALRALTRAVQLDERHAESHALLGTLYGMKIGGSLLRAAQYGPRVQKHCKKALELGADNPRVRYLIGTCQFHVAKRPAARREALATFLEAEKLFVLEARRPAGPLEPRWGRSSCLTFIGRTYEALGERAEAADVFRRALAEHPADHWAKEGLERVTANP